MWPCYKAKAHKQQGQVGPRSSVHSDTGPRRSHPLPCRGGRSWDMEPHARWCWCKVFKQSEPDHLIPEDSS